MNNRKKDWLYMVNIYRGYTKKIQKNNNMKTKFFFLLFLSVFIYVPWFFIPQNIIITNISLCLTLLLITYSAVLWLIDTNSVESQTIQLPMTVTISKKSLLDRGIRRFFIALFLVILVVTLLQQTSLWIMANGYNNGRVIGTSIVVVAILIFILSNILRKEIRCFYKKVEYKKKVYFQTGILLLGFGSICFGHDIKFLGICSMILLIGIILYNYIREHILLKPQNKANYCDYFQKPPR